MSKMRIRKTGEIVDVICFGSSLRRNLYDRVSYIDSKGVEHEEEHLNYYWDFEEISDLDATIDWGQRKFDVAKGILLKHFDDIGVLIEKSYVNYAIDNALIIANEFIDKYKKQLSYDRRKEDRRGC